MKKTILFILLIIFFSRPGFGQFNDSTHHRFSYSSTGIINQPPDVNSYVLNNMAAFEINQKNSTSILRLPGYMASNKNYSQIMICLHLQILII